MQALLHREALFYIIAASGQNAAAGRQDPLPLLPAVRRI